MGGRALLTADVVRAPLRARRRPVEATALDRLVADARQPASAPARVLGIVGMGPAPSRRIVERHLRHARSDVHPRLGLNRQGLEGEAPIRPAEQGIGADPGPDAGRG